jgi:hypothetical protein
MAEPDVFVIRTESPMPRWRPLVQWLLCLPHLLYTGLLALASVVAAVAAAIIVVVTGRVPTRLLTVHALSLRQRVRCFSYLWLLRTTRPPYATSPSLGDPGDDDLVTVSFGPPPATTGRSAPLVRLVILIPQGIVLQLVGIALDLTYPLWALYAAVNGGLPEGVSRQLVRLETWAVAVLRYALLMTDEAPPFGLAAYDVSLSPGRAAGTSLLPSPGDAS